MRLVERDRPWGIMRINGMCKVLFMIWCPVRSQFGFVLLAAASESIGQGRRIFQSRDDERIATHLVVSTVVGRVWRLMMSQGACFVAAPPHALLCHATMVPDATVPGNAMFGKGG